MACNHAVREHGYCFNSLSQLNIERGHGRGWRQLIDRDKENRGFGENWGCLMVTGERCDGQKVISRVKTIVAKILDGIPDVMILIA